MTDLPSRAPAESQEFWRRVLGWEPMIDLGWIVTLADPAWPGVRLSLISHDESTPVRPAVSVEVDHMDAAYAAASLAIPDGDGNVVNVLSRR